MNPLGYHEPRGLRRLGDLNFPNERQRSKRTFGRDITNIEKKSKNVSIFDKIIPNKIDVKPRSKSLYGKKEILPLKKDSIHEYRSDIMKFMLGLQKVDPSYKQKDVTEKMRQILIDWLVDVHDSFELKDQTLHLALHYLSDFASLKDISKEQYQLVGITCLWIASKYE